MTIEVTKNQEHSLSRRSFLTGAAATTGTVVLVSSGVAAGEFGLGYVLPESIATNKLNAAYAQTQTRKPDAPAAFIKIDKNNKVEIVTNRLEFGQGISTALPMILAEELDIPVSQISSSLGNNNPAYNDPFFGMHMTGGSNSIHNSYMQYRTIGATAKAMFLQAAATKWSVPVTALKTREGKVFHGKKSFAYSELIEDALKLPIPEKVNLKNTKQFSIIGKSTKRLDSKESINGTKVFGIDIKKEGLLVAVIARAPGFSGGKFTTYDASKALAIKGVKAVLEVNLDRESKGLAIVATGFWPAKMAREALQVSWQIGKTQGLNSEQLLQDFTKESNSPKITVLPWKNETTAETMSKSTNKVSSTFTFPYLAHAALEPLNLTVEVSTNKCEVWGAMQMPGVDTMAIAQFTALKPEQVQLNVLPAGGGFGRRAIPTSEFALEATAVAKAWKEFQEKNASNAEIAKLSRAVKVMWSREDDMRGGYYRPMHVHKAEMAFSDTGKLLAWDHAVVGQSILKGSPFEAMMVKDGIDATMTEGIAENIYNLPMRLRISHPEIPVPVLWWRSVGHTHTAFVNETLIDEIAAKEKKDPVAYRLENLDKKTHARSRAALELAVQKSGYGKKKLPPGRAYGVAVHESFRSAVAYVVEVSIKNGSAFVHKVTAGVHCNKVVNPLTAKTQIEGGMNFGLSMMMPGAQITLKDGAVVQSQLTEFSIPRLSNAPRVVDVHFVPSEENPTGLGEPGTPPILPAVANALAMLTGKRVRNIPADFHSLA